MNICITSSAPLSNHGGKPPLHPRSSLPERKMSLSSSFRGLVNKNIASAGSNTKKVKDFFEHGTVDSKTGSKKSSFTGKVTLTTIVPSKYALMSSNPSDTRNDGSEAAARSYIEPLPKFDAKLSVQVPQQQLLLPKSIHRCANNAEFLDILDHLPELRTLETPKGQTVYCDRPALDMATLRRELGKAIGKLGPKARQRRDSKRKFRWYPPHVPSVEERLEIRDELYSSIQYFWSLFDPKSSYISKTLKSNLEEVYEGYFDELREDLEIILTECLPETGSLTIDHVQELFTPCYENVLNGLDCMIGILQVFKRTKEPIGAFQHNLGVMWGYEQHTKEQNERLNFCMLKILYQRWERPVLEESDLVRIAVDEELSSIAVYEWWQNAVAIAWEPFHGTKLIPSHNLHGGRLRRRRRL
jgi:hypothetical protein